MAPKIAASTASAMIAIKIVLIVYFTKPVKPMKASDIKPAVIIAIDAPLNGTGTSAAAIRSRIEAKGSIQVKTDGCTKTINDRFDEVAILIDVEKHLIRHSWS